MIIKKQKFTCKRDSLTIRGYILIPQNHNKSCVIVSHGFSSNVLMTYKYAKRFANAGFVAVYFDFCGSGVGRSGGRSQDMSVLTQKEDLLSVLDYVKKIDYIDNKKIILAGCSQGGFVSSLVAAQREEDVEKLILYFPALSIPSDARKGSMLGAKFDPNNVPNSKRVIIIKIGKRYILDALSLDPYKEICTYKKPVLIIHGTDDKMVDISHSEMAQKKYPNAKLIKIDGGDHGFFIRGFKESMDESIRFLSND